MRWNKNADLTKITRFNDWTGPKLRAFRRYLGLYQSDIAKALDITVPTVKKIEYGESQSPTAIQLYGIVLERYFAYTQNYIPAFRKVGENNFMEINCLEGCGYDE